MKRSRTIALVMVVLLVIIIGFIAYVWVTGSDTPSAELVAPTIVGNTTEDLVKLYIQSDESEVFFSINEDLFSTPKQVIGATKQVAGELLIDFNNISNTRVGIIRINVRTLATDNEFRNRALRSQILNTSEFEFAEFVPQTLTDLPETVEFGTPFEFVITGMLTVRGISKDVAFKTTVTPVSKTRIEGKATSQILYSDFGISIPSAPGVANVSDEVTLEINFVALDTVE